MTDNLFTMSAPKKTVVFIKPLSSNLEKLNELLIEQGECQTLVVGSPLEAIALIKPVSPALFVTSSAKAALQISVKKNTVFKKNKNKMFILSPKKLPLKIVQKFNKFGIKDILLEPIVPKTLFFKISLLIRALPSKKKIEESTDEPLSVKKGSSLFVNDKEEKNVKVKEKFSFNEEEEEDKSKKSIKFEVQEEEIKKKKNDIGFFDINEDKKKKREDLFFDDEDLYGKKKKKED